MPELLNNENKNLTGVDEDLVKKTFNDLRGKSVKAIVAKRDETRGLLYQVHTEMKGGSDFSLAAGLGEGTVAQRISKFFEMHSELAGQEKALAEGRQVEKLSQEIRESNTGNGEIVRRGDPETDNRETAATPEFNIHSEWKAQMRRNGQSIESFDPMPHGPIMQTTVQAPRRGELMNALFKQTAGWTPEPQVTRGYVPSIQRPIQVFMIFPTYMTTYKSIEWFLETVYSNAAAEIAEGDASPEAELKVEKRVFPIEMISVHIPVTEIQLADEDQAERYLNDRLPMMALQRFDGQLINGSGITPNIKGMLTYSGLLDQDLKHNAAKVLTKPLNTFREARTKVELEGRAMPTLYLCHQTTWDEIAMSESQSGGYYGGNPFTGFVETCWGLPVVRTDHLVATTTENSVNALVGDFRMYSALYIRKDITIDYGWIGDDFTRHQLRLRACIRGALEVTRPQAFCTITRPA